MTHDSGSASENTLKTRSRWLERLPALGGALLASALLGGVTMACGSDDDPASPPPPPALDAGIETGTTARQWWDLGFKEELYNELVLFYLGHAWQQGSDVGEVLETASRVDESDPKSWTREWRKTAERLGTVAQESERTGHPVSAAQAYLRSATYYRAALHHHVEPHSAEVPELTQREVDAFGKYLTLSRSPCTPVQIPYEGTTLPGYFCKSSVAASRAPLVLYGQGRDAWAEDGLGFATEGMKRGYHVLMFDGPGQGKVIRLQGLPFRPDWERVLTPVVDAAIARPDVDPARVGMFSLSMGGYLGPRAATKEHRLKALVPNPGVIDWTILMESALKDMDPTLLPLVDTDEAAFNSKLQAMMNGSAFLRWAIEDFMWHHGVDTPAKLMKDLRLYKMTKEEVAQITTHTLVVGAEAETRGQPKELYDALVGRKDFLEFKATEAAQFHDQPGAEAIQSARIWEWLEGAL